MIFTVAIDGPAAAGKGTIGREVARRFGFAHLDTGALYRAVGVKGGDPVQAAQQLTPEDLARPDLRTLEAGQAASRVAALPGVRAALLDFQRRFARRDGGAVLDGRDIGTVICPAAEVKLYVTASAEVRARRRWLELGGAAAPKPYEAVLAEVKERDDRDMNRADAPLRPAADALILDTSDMTADEAIAAATARIGAAIARRDGPADVVFHLPGSYHDRWRDPPHLALYARLDALLSAHGRPPRLAVRRPGDSRPHPAAADGHLHITEGGAAQGPGWLNAALAYLTGFWHLDPEGVLADSSVRHDRFDPATVDPAAARAFADDLRARFVAPRRSRYRQQKAVTRLPQGAIAIFLQGPAPHNRGQAHMRDVEMIEAVLAAAGDRPVLVKPHPLRPETAIAAMADLRPGGPLPQMTGANIHDILAAAAVTVSINSAAAIEGMLHGKPAVLCGRADFAPLAETAVSPAAVAPALAAALSRPADHDAGLWWYFTRHTLDIDSPGFEARLFAHLARHGFPPERLGLGPVPA